MDARAEQIVLDYLRLLGDAAQRILRPDERLTFLARTRAAIARQVSETRVANPRDIERLLRQFGDPQKLAAAERRRLDDAQPPNPGSATPTFTSSDPTHTASNATPTAPNSPPGLTSSPSATRHQPGLANAPISAERPESADRRGMDGVPGSTGPPSAVPYRPGLANVPELSGQSELSGGRGLVGGSGLVGPASAAPYGPGVANVPELAGRPELTDRRGLDGRAGVFGRPSLAPPGSGATDVPESADVPVLAKPPELHERPGLAERPEMGDQHALAEQPDVAGQTDLAGRTAGAGRLAAAAPLPYRPLTARWRPGSDLTEAPRPVAPVLRHLSRWSDTPRRVGPDRAGRGTPGRDGSGRDSEDPHPGYRRDPRHDALAAAGAFGPGDASDPRRSGPDDGLGPRGPSPDGGSDPGGAASVAEPGTVRDWLGALLALVRKYPLECVAVAILGVGGLIDPFPLWMLGGLVVLVSRFWDTRDKLAAVAIPMAVALLGAIMLGGLNAKTASLSGYAHGVHTDGWDLIRAGAVLGAVYLTWRMRQGPRPQPGPPPWRHSRRA